MLILWTFYLKWKMAQNNEQINVIMALVLDS